jgi:nucleotide-binding universal stress UspA family protein
MYRSILVPLDGSPFGEQALPLALALTRRAAAKLEVVHVHPTVAPVYGEGARDVHNPLDDAHRRQEQTYLNGVVKRLTAAAPVQATTALLDGSVPQRLHEEAVVRGADLVIMTTHGRGPLARAWLGSVGDVLLRQLPMPLLLLRPHDMEPKLTGEPLLKHILIPLDGSPLAEQILEPAVALGSLVEADYTLVRVTRPMTVGGVELATPSPSIFGQTLLEQLKTLHEQEQADARDYLERVAERLRARSLRVQTRVVVHEKPAVAILDEIHKHPVDQVALATHGHGGLTRLFLGSVADKVVRAANVPVLVHRPHGH